MFTFVSVLAIAVTVTAASIWVCDGVETFEEVPSRRYKRRSVLKENKEQRGKSSGVEHIESNPRAVTGVVAAL